jgi:protein-S-isoprenylcysteine O-methyltransferase Ste14
MLTCKEITALATDYSEGHLGPAERALFEAHVAGCAGCTAWTRQLLTAAQAVARMPAPSVPLEQRAALLARFDEWAASRVAPEAAGGDWTGSRRRSAVVAAIATLGVFGLVVAMAHHPSRLPLDLGIAGVLVSAATVLAVLGRRVTIGSAAVAVSIGLGAALLAGRGGSLELSTGLECLLIVGLASAGSAGATWGWLRREPVERRRYGAGSSAVAGALAGVAALQLACGAHSSLVHLLTFHVGGLLAMAAAALLVSRPRTRHAGQRG